MITTNGHESTRIRGIAGCQPAIQRRATLRYRKIRTLYRVTVVSGCGRITNELRFVETVGFVRILYGFSRRDGVFKEGRRKGEEEPVGRPWRAACVTPIHVVEQIASLSLLAHLFYN
jgi:hypothetical protein